MRGEAHNKHASVLVACVAGPWHTGTFELPILKLSEPALLGFYGSVVIEAERQRPWPWASDNPPSPCPEAGLGAPDPPTLRSHGG